MRFIFQVPIRKHLLQPKTVVIITDGVNLPVPFSCEVVIQLMLGDTCFLEFTEQYTAGASIIIEEKYEIALGG
jgi:hypothetical protein